LSRTASHYWIGDRLESIICTAREVKRGDALYRTNDPFNSIYTDSSRRSSLKQGLFFACGKQIRIINRPGLSRL
jgi:hypothetical protein